MFKAKLTLTRDFLEAHVDKARISQPVVLDSLNFHTDLLVHNLHLGCNYCCFGVELKSR
jgi:hypothetical protein